MSTTIRVSDETRRRVAALATATGRQMQAVVDEAVLAYERSLFWESFESGWAELAADPERWAEVRAERGVEERALADGDR